MLKKNLMQTVVEKTSENDNDIRRRTFYKWYIQKKNFHTKYFELINEVC